MSLYRDSAVVLRTHKLGEADRIVVLMTRESGKVRAVAKGVRRTGSKFGSRLEPGSYAALQLHEGRGELDIVTQAETIESFRRTREDLSRLGRAASLLEAVEQLSEDRQPAPRLHDMLVGGLRTVDERNPPLVTGAFFLKLLAAEGVAPELLERLAAVELRERRAPGKKAGKKAPPRRATRTRRRKGDGDESVTELPFAGEEAAVA